jgi:hypothetical protein
MIKQSVIFLKSMPEPIRHPGCPAVLRLLGEPRLFVVLVEFAGTMVSEPMDGTMANANAEDLSVWVTDAKLFSRVESVDRNLVIACCEFDRDDFAVILSFDFCPNVVFVELMATLGDLGSVVEGLSRHRVRF